jgi:hypothetical protein
MVVGIFDVESRNYNIIFTLVFFEFSLVDGMLSVRCSKLMKELKIIYFSGESSDIHSKFICKLDGYVSKTTDTYDCTGTSWFGVSLEGCINCDSRAQEGWYLM